MDNIRPFFYHTRVSPEEGSAQCRGHLRDNINIKDDTHHSNKPNMKRWLWWPNDFLGPCGPKASWYWSYRGGKTSKNPHPGNLSRPGIEPGPAAWQLRMLPPAPQRWTSLKIQWEKFYPGPGIEHGSLFTRWHSTIELSKTNIDPWQN